MSGMSEPILFVDDEDRLNSEPEPSPQPEGAAPAAEPKPEPPQPEPSGPPDRPHFGPEEMTRALLAADQYRTWQAQREQAMRDYNARVSQALTPPPLPSGEEAEQLVLDEEALIKTLRDNQNWTRNALQIQQQMLTEQMGRQMQQMYQQAVQPVLEMRAAQAFDAVAERLYDSGIDGADDILDELHARLQQDPSKYWDLATNPRALEAGAHLVMRERGMAIPAAPVAGPVSAGYTPSNRATSPASSAAANDPALRAVERLFRGKVKWTDDDLNQYRGRVDWFRRGR